MNTYYYNSKTVPSFFARFCANILALGLSAYLLDNLYISNLIALIVAAFIFTFLNAIIKPILILLTLPLTIITLGLFYPVVNVIILTMLDLIMGSRFEIDGFFTAIIVTIIVAIVNYAVTHLFKENTIIKY